MSTEEPWIARSRRLLDGSLRDIDAPSRARLAEARRLAVEALPRRRWHGGWLAAAVAAGLGGAALIAMPLLLPAPDPGEVVDIPAPTVEPAPLAIAELDLLLARSEDEALLEDLEFYAWLAESLPEEAPGEDG